VVVLALLLQPTKLVVQVAGAVVIVLLQTILQPQVLLLLLLSVLVERQVLLLAVQAAQEVQLLGQLPTQLQAVLAVPQPRLLHPWVAQVVLGLILAVLAALVLQPQPLMYMLLAAEVEVLPGLTELVALVVLVLLIQFPLVRLGAVAAVMEAALPVAMLLLLLAAQAVTILAALVAVLLIPQAR
jgi:hypothetical protein